MGTSHCIPLGIAMRNVIPTLPCWGECKPMSRKRRALSQLYQAKGVAPGTVDAVSNIIPFGQKPSCIPAKGVGPKAQTWAWPAQIRARSCAGNPTQWDFRKSAEHSMCELTTGCILEKCPKSSVCTYHNMDFRKNVKHLMCELTTEWIFRKCPALSVCTYIYFWHYVLWFGSGELLIPWSERELRRSEWSGMLIGDPLGEASNTSSTNNELWLRREQHAHRWPSRWWEQMLALPIASSGERRTHSSEWEGTQTLRSGAQVTNRGLTSSNKGTKLRA